MVQGYYGLDEASERLGLSPDKLSQMAQRREIRAFADRGTWKFRTQDVDEMARRLGKGSSPELQLGEAPVKPTSKLGKPLSKLGKPVDPGSDQVDIGKEVIVDSPSGRHKVAGGRKSGHTPTPQPGSDSDVKLVFESSDTDFQLNVDSAVNLGERPSSSKPSSARRKSGLKADSKTPVKSTGPGSDSDVRLVLDATEADFRLVSDSDVTVDEPAPTAKPSSKKKLTDPPSSRTHKKTGLSSGQRADAGVRLVPFDDSGEGSVIMDQPPKSGSDSDIRIELDPGPPASSSGEIPGTGSSTMEIDLDEELQKAEEAAKGKKAKSKVKPKTKTHPDMPARSPFELSGDGSKKVAGQKPPSSDFELTPSDTLQLTPDSDEISLGEVGQGPGTSGINLNRPKDSGINLEKNSGTGTEQIEFELSLDGESAGSGPATPRPQAASPEIDSDSDFELTLDEGGELASADVSPVDDSSSVEGASGDADSEKDIFETDFEMPALDEESSSEAMPLDESDTDLESSDFDLSLNEEDSSSQVVSLEEGQEVDEGAATVAAGQAEGLEGDGEEIDELLGEEKPQEDEEEEAAGSRRPVVTAAPASWGVVPALLLFPCVIIMFLLGLMSFELLHGMWGYKQSYKPTGFVVKAISELIHDKLPDE